MLSRLPETGEREVIFSVSESLSASPPSCRNSFKLDRCVDGVAVTTGQIYFSNFSAFNKVINDDNHYRS